MEYACSTQLRATIRTILGLGERSDNVLTQLRIGENRAWTLQTAPLLYQPIFFYHGQVPTVGLEFAKGGFMGNRAKRRDLRDITFCYVFLRLFSLLYPLEPCSAVAMAEPHSF